MSFAYSVAIKLTVANLASQGVRMLAKDLMAAHGNAVALGDKIKLLQGIALGYGLDKVGHGMLGFIGKSIDASKEYTRQLSLMNAAGMGHLEIARATAAAWQTSKSVITTSAAENLKAIRELRSVFGAGGMGEAYKILPTVQRTKSILDALNGRDNEGVAFDMVKAIELRTPGLMSAGKMQSNADLMARTLMAMGGTLNAHDFHMTLKQSKTAAFGLNDDFVYNYLPTLIQEVKTGASGSGSSAGTALMSTYAAVIGGTMKKSAIPLWEAMGLIKPRDVVKNSTGALQLKPGAVRDSALFQANPYAWANQVLAPAIASYGGAHGLNREQVVTGLFGNRNAQWLINTLIAKAPQFERDRKLIQSGGNSYQTYQRLLQTNPQLAETAMHNQWQNVLSVIGYQILPKIIPLMVKFANGLDRIAQFMQRHPNLVGPLVIGFAALGGSLMVLGKVMMFVGMVRFLGMGATLLGMLTPIGLFVAGITVLSVGLYELYAHWNTVGPPIIKGLKFLGNGLADFFGVLTGIPGVGAIFRHFSGQDAPPTSPFVAARPGASQGHGNVYLDGKLVGKHIAPHVAGQMGKKASAPNRGISSFDIMSAPMRPATAR